jgi:hypothetical protein
MRHNFIKLAFLALAAGLFSNISAAAQNIDIVGPSGSGAFGTTVTALPNGNIVVTDPGFDAPGLADAGAVYLYNGATQALISTMKGTSVNDQLGSAGITVLTNGNFVVASTVWDNAGVFNAGAATWCSKTAGCPAAVTAANSLVGSSALDNVGFTVIALTNGNYVLRNPNWDNGGVTDAGAVSWGNGSTGTGGVVSAANSIVGSTASDSVGNSGVVALANGNYVVASSSWDNGGITDAGAVTFGNGTSGTSGTITAANSLVGSTSGDQLGTGGVVALTNGNYVARNQVWDNGAIANAGAATFGNGVTGTFGAVTTANSLVGSTAGDQVGLGGATALTNGNYVVSVPNWTNGGAANAGAATWGNGTIGVSGTISAANSLVGSTANDNVGGISNIRALSNGNYALRTPNWDNGASANVGAVTRGNGSTGSKGALNASNSVLGTVINGGGGMNFSFDATNSQLVVSRPSENIVTLSRPLGPTAASVSVSGRITYGKGFGVSGATVSLTDSQGNTRNVLTNNFGYYRFEAIAAGATYVLNVFAKRYQFEPQVLNVAEDVEDFNFNGQ